MFKHLIRRYVSLALVLALVFAASLGSTQTLVGSGENGLEKAIAAQEAHNGALFGIDGVVGTGVGLDDDGNPVVVVFTETAGVTGIPEKLGGVPVSARVTGKFFALHHRFGHCDGPASAPIRPECENGGGNSAPVADDQSVNTPEDTAKTITLRGSDADGCGTAFTFTITQIPDFGSLIDGDGDAVSGGSLTCSDPGDGSGSLAADVIYTPDSDTTDDSFTFTLSDGTANSNTATVSITVGSAITSFIGTSSGSDRLIDVNGSIFCTGGTLGFRATLGVGGPTVAVSNAHVYAQVGSTLFIDPDDPGVSTDRILQPGRIDLPTSGCGTADERDAAVIGNLADWVPFISNSSTCVADNDCNTVDVAIAAVDADGVGVSTPDGGYGIPSSIPIPLVDLRVNDPVQKYGRTTDLTRGHVSEINIVVGINYDNGVAWFKNQIAFQDNKRGPRDKFSAGGDSGALIVTRDGNNPVALLFAGSFTRTLGNPIEAVLGAFGDVPMTIDVTP